MLALLVHSAVLIAAVIATALSSQPWLTIRLGIPGVVPVAVTRTLTPVVLTLSPQLPSASQGEQSWATLLRAQFDNITYSSTTTLASGSYTGPQIQTWINAIGSGASATSHKKGVIGSGVTITLSGDTGLYVFGRSYLTLDFTGATVNQQTTGASNFSSVMLLENCTNVVIKGLVATGQMSQIGTVASAYDVHEKINGIMVRAGCANIKIDSCQMLANRGWPFFIGQAAGNGGSGLPVGVWIKDCASTGGETSFAIVAGRNTIVEGCSFSDATWYGVDVEPDTTADHITGLLIQNNTWTRFGWEAGIASTPYNGSGGHTHWWFAANPGYTPGATNSEMSDFLVRNNTIAQGHVIVSPGPLGGDNIGGGGLLVRINKANPKSDIVFTGNVSATARIISGSPFIGNAMTNLTVTGNTQVTVASAPIYAHAADAANVADVNITVTPNTVS